MVPQEEQQEERLVLSPEVWGMLQEKVWEEREKGTFPSLTTKGCKGELFQQQLARKA